MEARTGSPGETKKTVFEHAYTELGKPQPNWN